MSQTVNNHGQGYIIETSTSEEWIVLPESRINSFSGTVTLDCTGAGVSGYVQATDDMATVNSGGTVTALDTWPLGTISNTVGTQSFDKVYAIRFVAVDGAGQRMIVKV